MSEQTETETIPGVPANLKGKSYQELLKVFETFAKEKPGATNDEHIALGLIFLCALRDGDAARRAEFEQNARGAIERLERLAQPLRYVIPPHLSTEAELDKLRRELDGSGMMLLPAGAKVANGLDRPIPCSLALPAEEERVLFYVSSEPPRYRWKTGTRVPDGYHEPGKIWRADETSVGDELILFSAEQVTFWQPLPGEPE